MFFAASFTRRSLLAGGREARAPNGRDVRTPNDLAVRFLRMKLRSLSREG